VFETGETIVLGAEPFDPRVALFEHLNDRHRLIFHSSWPFWDDDFVPQPAYLDVQRRQWFDFVDGLETVAPTMATADALAELGADSHHIPHAVDTEQFHPAADSGTTLADRSHPTVFFAGRLENRKGISYLLDIAEAWADRPTEFRIAGSGPLADDVQSHDEVTFLGFLDKQRLAAEYAAADVFCLPSFRVPGWEELFGIVVIEAFACGTPVVSTDCVGPAELIEDGQSGYVVAQHDRDALAERLDAVLSDPETSRRMGVHVRERATTEFALDVVADDWSTVLGV
jgi:glycosyltransferase involved in cell wall biosynthesis